MDFSVINIDVSGLYAVTITAMIFLGANWAINKVVQNFKK